MLHLTNFLRKMNTLYTDLTLIYVDHLFSLYLTFYPIYAVAIVMSKMFEKYLKGSVYN